MTCKECLHYEICDFHLDEETDISAAKCLYFKNKADYVKVKYGRIIETIENGRMKRVFSCCGTDFTKLTMWTSPTYCPHCGAKMNTKGK